MPSTSTSSKANNGDHDTISTLWDINHERQEDRIRARRKRIANRIEAAKKLAALLRLVSILRIFKPFQDFRAFSTLCSQESGWIPNAISACLTPIVRTSALLLNYNLNE